MEHDPKVPPYHTSDQSSFAYKSAKDRWPVIITGVIDDVHRAVAISTRDEATKEGKALVENIASFKYELQHNRELTPLPDDGQPDIHGYNEELKTLGSPTWFSVPWLFGECYLYRRLNTLFTLTQHWKSYDPFSRQKVSTFRGSRAAVLELASRYRALVRTLNSDKTSILPEEVEQAEKLLFEEMCETCLWGNATDLSLLTNLAFSDIQKLQGSAARQNSKKNIIVDDLAPAFQALQQGRNSQSKRDRRIDIVLDNAGFELYVDLVLAGYLLAAGLATHVVFHPKSIPWFVSDVLPADFAGLLNALAEPQKFYTVPSETDQAQAITANPLSEQEVEDLEFLFQSFSEFHADGRMTIRPNRFWTHAGSYWRLPHVDRALWEDLQSSELVIFKGDLNYRKLTGDVMWDPTTPFGKAIGPLGHGSGVRILALRTCKADVVVGLLMGEDERLRATESGGGDSGAREWAWSGKWAVVQYSDGKSR